MHSHVHSSSCNAIGGGIQPHFFSAWCVTIVRIEMVQGEIIIVAEQDKTIDRRVLHIAMIVDVVSDMATSAHLCL